tara:strand:+ start:5170 stop:5538 length:369 start_codon:yes stop_codon:yes gene_type:complete
MIWDNLPNCLLEKVYTNILLTQPNKLLDDINNYKYTINYIHDNVEEHKFDDGADEWYILLLIIDIYLHEDDIVKYELFLKLEKYVKENKNLLIRYQGGFYWINRYIAKMSIIDRKQLILLII